jgi:hypothetical protein
MRPILNRTCVERLLVFRFDTSSSVQIALEYRGNAAAISLSRCTPLSNYSM